MSLAERKEREKEQRHTDIVDAAEKLFFSKKFDDVSMDDIAKAVELSRATLYLYFKDKESLYFAVILRGVTIMNRMFRECTAGETTGLGMISAIGNAFFRFNAEHADYYKLLRYSASQRFEECDNEYGREVCNATAEFTAIMTEAIKKGILDGSIKNDLDPLETAIFLINCSDSAITLDLLTKNRLERMGISHEDYIKHSMKLMGYAILKEKNNGV